MIFLKSGEKVEFKSLKILEESIEVTKPDKKTTSFPLSEVERTCDAVLLTTTSAEVVWFKKPQFIKYDYEGKINVASFEVVSGGVGQYAVRTVSIYYYAIKDGVVYDLMNNVLIRGNQKRRDLIEKLVADQPEIANLLSDTTIRVNGSYMLDVIKKYNLATFQPSEKMESPSTVFFYSSLPMSKDYTVTLSINDSEPKTFTQTGVLPLSIDSKKLSKVCIRVNGLSSCFLTKSSLCGFSYKEIRLKEGVDLKDTDEGKWKYFQKNRIK
jgi:hypothetical protein